MIDIPFIFGQRFNIYGYMYIYGHGGDWRASGTCGASAKASLQWLGATVLDANSNAVTSFTPTSEAGIDWAVIQPALAGTLEMSVTSLINQTNLAINATGGTPSNHVYLLSSTNLALPKTNWSYLGTNRFDIYGHVSFTNAIVSGVPQRFFLLLSE